MILHECFVKACEILGLPHPTHEDPTANTSVEDFIRTLEDVVDLAVNGRGATEEELREWFAKFLEGTGNEAPSL